GTTTGTVRVRGQVIDGKLDLIEFAPFTFTPDAVKSLKITYPSGIGQSVTLTDVNAAAHDLAVTPTVITEGQPVAVTGALLSGELTGRPFRSIEWGDGPPNEMEEPGRDSFSFTHTYANNPYHQAQGGTYTIQLHWFNEFGFGNRQTRVVTVNNAAPV